jgi:hypothetical protein
MNSTNWRKLLIWILKANIAVWIIDILVLAVLFVLSFDLITLVNSAYFSKMLLLEAGIVFIIGGFIAFSSGVFSSKAKENILHKHEDWSVEKLEKSEKKANPYILLGVVLFAESLILSLFAL